MCALYETRRGTASDLARVESVQSVSPGAAEWPVEDYLAHEFLVVEDGAAVAGFLVARRLGEGESEILNLAVHPQWRRKGVASALVEAWIRETGGDTYLEVRESNTAARTLYQTLGFQQVALRKDYYDEPREGAIVLKFHSC